MMRTGVGGTSSIRPFQQRARCDFLDTLGDVECRIVSSATDLQTKRHKQVPYRV